jgi:hypothetical protein
MAHLFGCFGTLDSAFGFLIGSQFSQGNPAKFSPGAMDVGVCSRPVLAALGESFCRVCGFLHIRKPPKQKNTKLQLKPGNKRLQLVFRG